MCSGCELSYTDSMSTSSGGPTSVSRSRSSSSSGDISISTGLEAAESACSSTPAVPVGVSTSGALVSGTAMSVVSSGCGLVVGVGVVCAGFSRRYCWEVDCSSAFFLSRCCWSRAMFRRCLEVGGALAASWLVVAGVCVGLIVVAGLFLLFAGGVIVVDVLGRGTGAAIRGWGGGRSSRADGGDG